MCGQVVIEILNADVLEPFVTETIEIPSGVVWCDGLKPSYQDATTPLSDTDKFLIRQGSNWKEVDKSELGGEFTNFKGSFKSEFLMNLVSGKTGDFAILDLGMDIIIYIWNDKFKKWNIYPNNQKLKKQELITSITNQYLTNTGVVGNSMNFNKSQLINVIEGEYLYYTGEIANRYSNACAVGGYFNGTFVSCILGYGVYNDELITIPNGINQITVVTTGQRTELSLKRLSSWLINYNNNEKIWCAIGDSITYQGSYIEKIEEKIGFKAIINRGVSGATLTNDESGKNITVITENLKTADIYTIYAGTNDFSHNLEIGTISDYDNSTGDSTYYGALRVMVDRIYNINPNAILFLFTNTRRDKDGYDSFNTNSLGYKLNDYNEAIRYISKKYGIEIIDLWNESGINEYNLNETTLDGLHPNEFGSDLIAQTILKKIKY